VSPGRSIIGVMSHYRPQGLLGKAVFFAIVNLVMAIPGCGSDTSATDGGASKDTWREPADGPSDGLPAADRGASDVAVTPDLPADKADVQKVDSAPDILVDPACIGADPDGFFTSCTSCVEPGNCETLTVGSRSRQACGCEVDGDCPCGFTCGCYTMAASVRVCGICVR
jgi:hypothetical protein